MERKYGAMIERGEVIEKNGTGYRIKSFDRDGIITSILPAINGKSFSVGQRVYFFMFFDGSGLVISEF